MADNAFAWDDLFADIAFAPAADGQHGLLDLLGMPEQFFPSAGEFVAGLATDEERLANMVFECGDAAPQRRGAQPRGRGGRRKATQPRHVEKQAEIIPGKGVVGHFLFLQSPLRSFLYRFKPRMRKYEHIGSR